MNDKLNAIAEKLNARESLTPLSPRNVWDASLEKEIESLNGESRRRDVPFIALIAALHLRNDSLDVSHSYAQEIEHDATGAYWHGIMHRMEGDYWNAKYWFNRVGRHPVMAKVQERAADWLKGEALEELPQGRIRDTLISYRDEAGWNAGSFVDLVDWQERSGDSGSGSAASRRMLEQLQHIEMIELFEYTWQAAL